MQGPGGLGLGNHGPMSIAMPGPPPMDVAYAGGRGAGPAVPAGPMMPGDPMMPGGAMGPGGPMMPGGPMAAGGAMPAGGPMMGGPMGAGGVQPASAHGPGCACCSGAVQTGGYLEQGGMGCGDGLCADCGGTGCLFCNGVGCEYCGGQKGCRLCGTAGGRLGCAPVRNLVRSTGLCGHHVGADGCYACGWGNNALLPGHCSRFLGRLAPFSEGPQAQRWFDFYVGTMARARTDSSPNQVVTTQGIAGTPVLRTSDPNLDQLAFGLMATAALQVGPGSGLELTYFGLNKWHDTVTATSNAADLYSRISQFGTSPPGGFTDTDQSSNQSLTYDSAIHNAELNFRRRWVAPARWIQGSWLAGVRYFDLDEEFGYQAVGMPAGTLNFFDFTTATRNELTGFQLGSDLWVTVVPGLQAGIEGKYGVYGNHAETESNIKSNSILSAREAATDGETAYLGEFSATGVYRVTYSWAFRASYNYLRVDSVALAPRNFNVDNLAPNITGLGFGTSRIPQIDVDGVAKYSGFTLGAEYTW
ncbi:MAG: hypothetical protein ACTHK7_17995 [Aureliella sp.]